MYLVFVMFFNMLNGFSIGENVSFNLLNGFSAG